MDDVAQWPLQKKQNDNRDHEPLAEANDLSNGAVDEAQRDQLSPTVISELVDERCACAMAPLRSAAP